ncbi:MAG: SpoIIE family protein phosphatase, partial [Cyclobacteriaceae bacterium]|nr:SpoIIE family protein phosphatase [Cyclobacteriaceae bacterium]
AALRKAESDNDTVNTIHTARRLGEYYERYSRPHEAIPYYRRAYDLSKHTDSTRETASLSNLLAWNYHKTKQVDSALRFAEEAVRRHRALPSRVPESYAVALESLGEIYSLKGRYAEAELILDECMDTGRKANNEIIQGFTRYGLAFNAFNQGKYEEARKYILGCVPVAARYATPEALALVYRLAYEVHDALRQEKEALRFLKEFTALNDRLHSEDIEKKAAIINANFEIQKKEDDLRLLAQQNAIQKLEIEQRALTLRITIGAIIALLIIVVLVFNRIQNKRKFERMELQRKNEELEQARRVQLSLLPKQPLQNELFEVHGKMITATEVGGDYFDFIPLDPHRVLIAFGDATGHGMTAGMMVTITKVALLNNLSLLKDSNDVVPVARAINESILASVSVKGIGMALQLCVVDAAQKTLSITSCGMPYPVVANPETGTLETAIIRQPPLGFLRSVRMELRQLHFKKGDLLVLTSDGILERFNRTREEYGIERLTGLLQRAEPHDELQQVLDSIFTDTDAFASGVAHHDDMTALCARLRA